MSGSSPILRKKLTLRINGITHGKDSRMPGSNLNASFPFQYPGNGGCFFTTAGMQFNEVPAGKFLMGSSKKDLWATGSETPQHIIDLPYVYYMARFPITNEEYAAYMKSEGILYPRSNWKNMPNHPAVNISWKEAMGYCHWLNAVLRGELPFGLMLRLPTEAEWEKAARGKKHFVYPWGNVFEHDRNNSEGDVENGTTPVAEHSPQGDSPYGCADMTGNVWEWTHSLFRDYPYDANDGRESEMGTGNHAARGGWFAGGQNARNTCRASGSDQANSSTGFRLVVSCSLV